MKALIAGPAPGAAWEPLTYTRPKPLLPVANLPLLAYALKFLKAAGIVEVVLALGLSPKETVAALGSSRPFGIHLHFTEGSSPRNLKEALRAAAPLLGGEAFFLYPEGYLFHNPPPRPRPGPSGRTLVLLERAPDGEGNVLYKDGRIINVILRGERAASTGLNQAKGAPTSGMQAGAADEEAGEPEEETDGEPSLSVGAGRKQAVRMHADRIKTGARATRRLLTQSESSMTILPAGFFPAAIHELSLEVASGWDIAPVVKLLLEQGLPVEGYRVKATTVRKPHDLLQANRILLEKITPGIEGMVDSASQISGRVQIGEGTEISRSILRGPLVIGPSCQIKDAYIGPNTSLEKGVTVEKAEVENSILLEEATVRALRERLSDSVIGRGSVIERNSMLPKATRLVIGDGARVETN